jgi:hypothetical protein
MSETHNDARNAVVYIDGEPHLDLAADVYTYPILLPDERHKLMVSMRAYKPYSVKKFYDQCIPKRKQRSAAERSIESPDYEQMHAFVMEHFISFTGAQLEDGSEPTIEQQREWLKANPVFQERIFRFGMDTVGRRRNPDLEAEAGNVVLLFGQREHRIPMESRLYSPERQCEEAIQYTAHMERLSQSQKHQYAKAIAVIENARRGELYQESNWDVIEQLTDHSLKRLDGPVVFDGQPCTEANREKWLSAFPLIAKIFCMSQAIGEIDVKNA